MSTSGGILSRLIAGVRAVFRPSGPTPTRSTQDAAQGTRTREIVPPPAHALTIAYRPERDGDPDAGEVVWTWVPYQEDPEAGKDRPVLVIGRHDARRVYAVKLTSKAHEQDRDYLPIGAGAWDRQGRESWVDLDQFYLVHHDGMRREAAALDRERFGAVAQELHRRYGWAAGR